MVKIIDIYAVNYNGDPIQFFFEKSHAERICGLMDEGGITPRKAILIEGEYYLLENDQPIIPN
ncbi:MAG: hypothetical protein WCT26_01365 [Candidatus Buchananbacteria bacterium]|jgi:hypothetical protein